MLCELVETVTQHRTTHTRREQLENNFGCPVKKLTNKTQRELEPKKEECDQANIDVKTKANETHKTVKWSTQMKIRTQEKNQQL